MESWEIEYDKLFSLCDRCDEEPTIKSFIRQVRAEAIRETVERIASVDVVYSCRHHPVDWWHEVGCWDSTDGKAANEKWRQALKRKAEEILKNIEV